MNTTVTAYHFVGVTLRDGRPIPADGEWLEHEGPVVICESGLHASEQPFDALAYAPGNTLCLVEVDGVEGREHDKIAGRRRKIIKRIDAEQIMRYFARWCAATTRAEYLREAAREAAWYTSWDATWAAERADGTGDFVRGAQRERFNKMVYAAFGLEG